MDSKTLLGAAIGAAVAIGGMAVAQHYSGRETGPEQSDATAAAGAANPAEDTMRAPVDDGYGDVRSVHPVVEKVTTPRKVCEDVTVRRRAPGSDNHVVGTVVGAAVGGLLGNKIGRGHGREAATVAGAVGGGFVGHEIGVRHDANNTVASTETRCHTVNDSVDKVTGYDVTYEHQGRSYTTRMDYDPGPRLQLDSRDLPVVTPTATQNAAPPPR
jgi:uncharacterized protein YcfJ